MVTVGGELEPGDEVVVEGVLRLRDGQTVVKADRTATSGARASPGSQNPVR